MHNMEKIIGEIHAMLIEYEKGLPKKAETPQVMMIKSGKIQLNAKGNNKGFRIERKLKQRALYLYVGNGVRAQVEAIGSFDLAGTAGAVSQRHRALGAKRDAQGSTMFGIGGGIMRARVMSIVAWCCCDESSLEVSFGLKSWNLKNGKKLTVEPAGRCLWLNNTGLLQRAPTSADHELDWLSFGALNLDTRANMQEANLSMGSTPWLPLVPWVGGGVGDPKDPEDGDGVIGLNIFEESSKEHGIWKSHLTTLSHAHHSVDDVVGEVEAFADGETIKHVAKRHVWMIFVTGETNDIFIENEVPFVEGILELGVKHLKWFESFIVTFDISKNWFGSLFE
ncbi:hypothetical protein Tco_0046424 [Tanacetum coccineum]